MEHKTIAVEVISEMPYPRAALYPFRSCSKEGDSFFVPYTSNYESLKSMCRQMGIKLGLKFGVRKQTADGVEGVRVVCFGTRKAAP